MLKSVSPSCLPALFERNAPYGKKCSRNTERGIWRTNNNRVLNLTNIELVYKRESKSKRYTVSLKFHFIYAHLAYYCKVVSTLKSDWLLSVGLPNSIEDETIIIYLTIRQIHYTMLLILSRMTNGSVCGNCDCTKPLLPCLKTLCIRV